VGSRAAAQPLQTATAYGRQPLASLLRLEDLSRADVAGFIRDAFDNPAPADHGPGRGAGAPRHNDASRVQYLVVFKAGCSKIQLRASSDYFWALHLWRFLFPSVSALKLLGPRKRTRMAASISTPPSDSLARCASTRSSARCERGTTCPRIGRAATRSSGARSGIQDRQKHRANVHCGMPVHSVRATCGNKGLRAANALFRYGYVPSPSKPVVDKEPYQWTHCGRKLDLFAVSQDPHRHARYTIRTTCRWPSGPN
jgi:hypothetical protein